MQAHRYTGAIGASTHRIQERSNTPIKLVHGLAGARSRPCNRMSVGTLRLF